MPVVAVVGYKQCVGGDRRCWWLPCFFSSCAHVHRTAVWVFLPFQQLDPSHLPSSSLFGALSEAAKQQSCGSGSLPTCRGGGCVVDDRAYWRGVDPGGKGRDDARCILDASNLQASQQPPAAHRFRLRQGL
ncbi:hypothetical protein FA15DRAFT_309132 [Coprinopsis marcescibilis]|uniref:Uncharacterized protein n=1 Tax=Coprinopsis marcescibilis TaxID=230819 RepID=A0A5C3KCK5_COPMA|nr:hypothetical protein FA15DRAFT_309132 [Coprinopsis marcescibilis]